MAPTVVPVALVGAIRAAWSDRSHGDLREPAEALPRFWAEATGATSAAGPGRTSGRGAAAVYRLRQVHGAIVHVVAAQAGSGDAGGVAGTEGDALVSSIPGTCLAMLTADCASLALGSTEGVFAAVHAGWRGLVAGVVEAAVAAMRAEGATAVTGALGPCIHAECYEFSDGDLGVVASRYGAAVRAVTSEGRPALDLPATVAAALDRAGAGQVAGVDACTGCTGRYFSHRKRGDVGRQALVVWSATGEPG